MDDSQVAAYQELLEIEKKKIDDFGLSEPLNRNSLLSYEEVRSVCRKYNVEFEKFISSDLMVEYPGFGWRTMHFDLIYRIVNIRNLERQTPIPLEYRVEIQSEPVPDFDTHKFSEVLTELIPNEFARNIVLSALAKSKYKGLSSHQLVIVKELLSRKPRYRTAAIVAPTASGKTLAFFLPVIVKAVERSIEGKNGVSSVLVYPRKALERDQLQSFLTIIDSVNKMTRQQITIGIDDGDTRRLNEIIDGDTYREMKCLKCSNSLIVEKKGGAATVRCGTCSKEYSYILATKDEIWQKRPTILITNTHTVYRRLLAAATVKVFAGIDYLVFDEAHVYTDYLGGHVSYIIKLLRHVAQSNGSSTYLVFSSATIPNPHDFIARLAGCEDYEIFYVDYKKTLENVRGIGRRLMLYLYLLPHPDSSVETLTEALILAVTLWCHRHNLKAITFVDSVAEISTLSDYIHTTILNELGERQGREVTDHLYSTSDKPENSYNWRTLAPPSVAVDLDTFKRFVLNQYKTSIDIHYGQLRPSERARVEYNFSQGLLKLLISTSTLELGIDLSDVAAIIQHKLPITPEGVVQRVGRSGRSSVCLRVALGIIALQSSPLGTLYMFDERLRGRLADPNLLPPAKVGQTSASIKLQHTLSLLLYKRALENRSSFVTGEEYLRSRQEVVYAVREIADELNDDLVAFNAKVGLFADDNIIRSQISELKSLISSVVKTVENSCQGDFDQIKKKWEDILSDIDTNANKIKKTLQSIEQFRMMLGKIQAFNTEVLSELESLECMLRQVYRLLIGLLRTAKSSYNAGDPGPLRECCIANSSYFEAVAKQVPNSDDILSRLLTPLINWFGNKFSGSYKTFRANYGFGFDRVLRELTNVTQSLGAPMDKGLASFLRKLPDMLKFLQSANLVGLIAYESLKRIETELKSSPSGIDIIDAINLLLLNRVRLSLMLEQPSPELQLAGAEAA